MDIITIGYVIHIDTMIREEVEHKVFVDTTEWIQYRVIVIDKTDEGVIMGTTVYSFIDHGYSIR